jgi:hypothetical protein
MATFEAEPKDPSAVLDYQINWADWLPDGDTLSTSTWTAETGLTVDSESETTTAATVWLSGGTATEDYVVTNEVVTAGGRTDQRSILVPCRER